MLGPRNFSAAANGNDEVNSPGGKRPRNNDGRDSEESDADLFKDEEESQTDKPNSELVKQEIEQQELSETKHEVK